MSSERTIQRTVEAVAATPGRTGVELKAKVRKLALKEAEDRGLIVYRDGGWHPTAKDERQR